VDRARQGVAEIARRVHPERAGADERGDADEYQARADTEFGADAGLIVRPTPFFVSRIRIKMS
jgi:hypothetical protein